MRAQGEYDFVKHEWIRKTSCLVCKSIKEINFVLEKCFVKQKKENGSACGGVCECNYENKGLISCGFLNLF